MERLPAEREIKVVRPLYSVEVTETETAKFETEISEEDIHATWKLKGETLHPSAVRTPLSSAPPASADPPHLCRPLNSCLCVPGRGGEGGGNPTRAGPLQLQEGHGRKRGLCCCQRQVLGSAQGQR